MQPSRLVVLAAGMGSRLLLGPKARAGTGAKPLTRIGGVTLLERTMVEARRAGFDEVVVVTGHNAERVAAHALEVSRRRGVPLRLVHNDRYRDGNGLSVLAATDAVADEPFALVMADHVFAPGVLGRLRSTPVGGDEVVVAVDPSLGRAVGVDPADAMKVSVSDGAVCGIGKDLDRYDAFDVGAFVCGPALFAAVERASARGDTSLAAAVQILADRGAARALALRSDEWWFDVDTRADHRRGSRHLHRGTGKALDGAVAARVNRAVSQRIVTPALLRAAPGITPNQVSLLALVVALGATGAFFAGRPLVAGLLILLASVLDGSDGEIARIAYRSSSFGAFFDAVLDRVGDGFLLTGIAAYLARSPDLAGPLGRAQVPVAVAVTGLALVGHLLVSYTTAKAAVDLGHRYEGRLVGGGHGRDLRLLALTAGAVAAPIHAGFLLAAVVAIAVLCAGIVVLRLWSSWWSAGEGATYIGVEAVAFDFDGTVADTMGALTDAATRLLTERLGLPAGEALRRYLATTGDDFRTQLAAIAPGHPDLDALAADFESGKVGLMELCRPFADGIAAVERLRRAGLPVLVCSSTRAELVQRYCAAHGLAGAGLTVDGWSAGRPKVRQLSAWTAGIGVAPDRVVFVGDSRRDSAIARAAGVRFVGLSRPGHHDGFAGSGLAVVASLTDVSRRVIRTRRLPVRMPQPGPALAATAVAEASPLAAVPLEVADVVGSHQAAHPVDHPDGRDGAVGHLDVAVDLRPGAERPRDGGPDDDVVGEHRDGSLGV
ncbi:MAG: NTP transferase domain-containing protein [Actinobacteria bacterium]|nr:NTP transferase domain-containing protein [Actinomycetota bacterium]